MKLRTAFFLLLCSRCTFQASAQYEIPNAQQQPAWVFPIYFEDASGSRDTVYYAFDTEANDEEGWPLYADTSFGEMYMPMDSIGFSAILGVNPWWVDVDSVLKVIVEANINGLTLTLVNCRLPVSMTWDSQLFYSDSLPFSNQGLLPKLEVVLWPSSLNSEGLNGETCGFTEPVILSDTSAFYAVCTYTDSISFDSWWECSGCVFNGDFDLTFRQWTGGWVDIPEIEVIPKFLVYPNPITSNLNIETNFSEIYKIQIVDSQGRLVLESTSSGLGSVLAIESLVDGVYTIVLTSENYTYSQLIIKNNN